MKVQRITGVNGENERAAKGLQLTRVVPPSISVPFLGRSVRRFFYATGEFYDFPIHVKRYYDSVHFDPHILLSGARAL